MHGNGATGGAHKRSPGDERIQGKRGQKGSQRKEEEDKRKEKEKKGREAAGRPFRPSRRRKKRVSEWKVKASLRKAVTAPEPLR